MNLAMDAVPPSIDHDAVGGYLRALPGVSEVHDLPIWGMSTTERVLTAHLVRTDGAMDADLLHLIPRCRHGRGVDHLPAALTLALVSGQCGRSCLT